MSIALARIKKETYLGLALHMSTNSSAFKTDVKPLGGPSGRESLQRKNGYYCVRNNRYSRRLLFQQNLDLFPRP